MKKDIIHFAHANGFPGGTYKRMLEPLNEKYNIIVMDRLGHNPLYPVNNNWTNLADELIANIEKESSSPVIGVGHSLGSLVTFIAAWNKPHLFKGIIMLDPPFVTGFWSVIFNALKLTGLADRITPAGQSRGRRSFWNDMDEVNNYFQSKKLFAGFHPQCLQDYIESGIKPCSGGYCLHYDGDVEVKIFQTMPHNMGTYRKPLPLPGSLIYGDRSHAVHLPTIKKFTNRHGLRLLTSPGGHLFPMEKPDEAGEILMRELAIISGL